MSLEVDEILLERIKEHLICVHQYPRCAAIICAYMHFDYSSEGVTFEDLTEKFGMSKSTVSASLNLLLEAKHITFFNKEDSRKRFFRIDKGFVIRRYRTILDNIINEKALIQEMKIHKSVTNVHNEELDERFDILLDKLESGTINIGNAIKKLEDIH